MPNEMEASELIEFIKTAIKQDDALREKYQIGDKFRFIRDKLHALLHELEKHHHASTPEKKKQAEAGVRDEGDVLVYVYLFNAQGTVLQTWIKMLTPKLFYEYSVNRPIYTEQAMIESLVRSKANRVQHGYLTITVKKENIIPSDAIDGLGNPVVKVKEGSLLFDRLVSLAHNDEEHVLNDNGVLVRKPTPDKS